MEEIPEKIADPKMHSQIEKMARFHSYLSTGTFAGIRMPNIAERFWKHQRETGSLSHARPMTAMPVWVDRIIHRL